MRLAALVTLAFFVLCQLAFAAEPSPKPTTDDEAKLMLKQSYHLWNENKLSEAISLLEAVVSYNPKFEAEFPEERSHLRARSMLGHVYKSAGQWEKSLSAFDLAEEYAQERGSYEPTMLPYGMSDCREKLAEQGKAPADPLIVVGGWVYRGGKTMQDGSPLVSASDIAPKLGLTVSPASPESIVFTSKGKKPKSLKVTIGSKTASGSGKTVRLSVAPRKVDDTVFVPLRAVSEFFGGKVKWDAASKVAWIE